MPIYEYCCQSCGYEFEKMQKFSDLIETICPTCKGPVKRKISTAGFQLKGAGWYKDGYSPPKTESSKEQTKESESKTKETKSPNDSTKTKSSTSKEPST